MVISTQRKLRDGDLAVLELARLRQIRIEQEKEFGTIFVTLISVTPQVDPTVLEPEPGADSAEPDQRQD